MIVDPVTIPPDYTVGQALEVMSEYRISGLPVVKDGQLVGILTNRDVRFVTDMSTLVSEVMTSKRLVTVPVGHHVGTSQEAPPRKPYRKNCWVGGRRKQIARPIDPSRILKRSVSTPPHAKTTPDAYVWGRP